VQPAGQRARYQLVAVIDSTQSLAVGLWLQENLWLLAAVVAVLHYLYHPGLVRVAPKVDFRFSPGHLH